MSANRSSVSNAKSYQEIGEFWDGHDAGDLWGQSSEANFEVDLKGLPVAEAGVFSAVTTTPRLGTAKLAPTTR